jgi:hypothetical protein
VRSSGFFFTYSTAYNGAANTNCGGNSGSTDADVDADKHQQAWPTWPVRGQITRRH